MLAQRVKVYAHLLGEAPRTPLLGQVLLARDDWLGTRVLSLLSGALFLKSLLDVPHYAGPMEGVTTFI